MNNENTIESDIVIIGGGIAGCIAATSLASTYNVTLIDKLTTPIDKIGESLAPTSQRIFKELGIFQNNQEFDNNISIKSLGMQSYWGSEQQHIVDHLKNPDGFVRNVDRKAFEAYLRKTTIEKDVHCLWGLKLYSSQFKNGLWEIIAKSDTLKNRTTKHIKAKFVIDASGRQANFTKSIGIQRIAFDALIACWFTIPDDSKNKMSTIIADKLGWWYSAVTPNNKRIISFQTDADLVNKTTFKTLENFLAFAKNQPIINNLIAKNEANIIFKGTVSANSSMLSAVAGTQWVAIGDAAISFDPLSSQGMFNAMANAMQVQKLINEYNIIKKPTALETEKFNHIYTNQVVNVWQHYLKHKKLFYSAETRWKKHLFWARRH